MNERTSMRFANQDLVCPNDLNMTCPAKADVDGVVTSISAEQAAKHSSITSASELEDWQIHDLAVRQRYLRDIDHKANGQDCSDSCVYLEQRRAAIEAHPAGRSLAGRVAARFTTRFSKHRN